MSEKLDALDWKIIEELQKDMRKPFLEIAREMNVSGGTIYTRFNRMKKDGYIKEGCLVKDPRKLGYEICAFIGVRLNLAQEDEKVVETLSTLSQIVEVHYTIGRYDLLLKVVEKKLPDLHRFLKESLQVIPGIQSTETLLSMNVAIGREIILH